MHKDLKGSEKAGYIVSPKFNSMCHRNFEKNFNFKISNWLIK